MKYVILCLRQTLLECLQFLRRLWAYQISTALVPPNNQQHSLGLGHEKHYLHCLFFHAYLCCVHSSFQVNILLLAVKSYLRNLGTYSYFQLLTYSDSGGLCGSDNLYQNDLLLHIRNISDTRCFTNFLWGSLSVLIQCATSLCMLIRVFGITITTLSVGCTA
jgi:hypothetical protein